MRRLLIALVALFCVVLLSSCSLLSLVSESSDEMANARMEEIAEALNTQDASALKLLFSPYAVERATGLDDGLEYLLSFFPNGGVTWERYTVSQSKEKQGGQLSDALWASYTISVDGTDYRLFFADFVANDANPEKLGLYGLGVTPLTEGSVSSADVGIKYWVQGLDLYSDGEYGYPGIYVPNDDILYPPEQADARMAQIASALNTHDAAALGALFASTAAEEATNFEGSMAALLAIFPSGDLTWQQSDVALFGDDLGTELKLLISTYDVSAGGEEYFLYLADFIVDAENPDNVGLASLAVTPWFDPYGDDKDEAYIDWTPTWDFEAEGRVGIYVPAEQK